MVVNDGANREPLGRVRDLLRRLGGSTAWPNGFPIAKSKMCWIFGFVLTWCVFSLIRCLGHVRMLFQPIELQCIFVSARQTVLVVRNAG